MNCLVTGCAGFIGSHLSERLVAEGHAVVGVDAFTDYYPPSIKEGNPAGLHGHPRFRLVRGSLLELDLAPLLDGVDVVFHLAAQAGVRPSWGRAFQVYTEPEDGAGRRPARGDRLDRPARSGRRLPDV